MSRDRGAGRSDREVRVTPADKAREARRLIAEDDVATRFAWAPAAVILARQALEGAIDRHYHKFPSTRGIADATWKEKLICLPHYFRKGDAEGRALVERVVWCWVALSTAAHERGLAMTPSASDIAKWLETVEHFVAAVDAA